MKTSDFDYSLPEDRIAQTPIEPRDASRLLVLEKATAKITHDVFSDILKYLHPGDLLVMNQSRVIPARLYATKIPTGGKVEVLLLSRRDAHVWEAMVGGKRLTTGKRLAFGEEITAEVIDVLDGPRRLIRFDKPVDSSLDKLGVMPLPPYIHTPLANPERYQTIYARESGSAAAPTAGLHFTSDLLQKIQAQGIGQAFVTLHVGLDTFAPVGEDNPLEHTIHTEWCSMPEDTARMINQTHRQGGRIIAVGTTSVRVIESAAACAAEGAIVGTFSAPTDLFILPGYQFKAVDAIITNFHLPRSTLLMMISAFVGRETILQTYQTAVEEKYRFYSFGDAMLIL